MTTQAAAPSLRRRLLLSLLIPGFVLAVMLGEIGAFLIGNVVTVTNDRLLEASLLTIAGRIHTEEGHLTVDIPVAALSMLSDPSQDSVYYGVLYDGDVVTGYGDLPLDERLTQIPDHTVYWNGVYKGMDIRLAGQMHWVYGEPKPVLAVVAQTTLGRVALRHRLLFALAYMETVLLAVLGALAWFAVDRGLQPLTDLSDEINARGIGANMGFAPLNPRTVPREALAPVTAFNALLARLDETVGAIHRFTADASHQMRTPLAVMRTHLALARRHATNPLTVGTSLSELDAVAVRLDHMVNQLIILARADENSQSGMAATCDLGEIVTELVADKFPAALAAGVEIQLQKPEGPIAIRGLSLLVHELTANLLDNAVRYNHAEGGVEVRIDVDGEQVRMAIEDTGPGIPVAERARVFERFYRLPRRNGPTGSGLGLAIVRTSCERIGAAIALSDRASGSGLVATVTFRASDRFTTGTPR